MKRLFVLVACGAGALVAAALVARAPAPPSPHSIGSVTSSGVTYSLTGLMSEGCVTTLRACLARLPGVERMTVSRESATLLATPPLDEKQVIAAVRESGHEVAGSEAVLPRLAPLTADEERQLDELKGEWLECRVKPPQCLDCGMAFDGRVKELAGVKEVVVVHFRDHLVVRRDPVACPASHLAAHLRALTHEPVAISPTKLVHLRVDNMTCNRCIGSIRGVLFRTDRVLWPTVEIGWTKIVVSSGTEAQKMIEAVESAPGPSCKTTPEHVFKASLIDEKDDAVQR